MLPLQVEDLQLVTFLYTLPVRFLSRIVLTASLLIFPAATYALQQTIWNFQNGNLPGAWRISGLDIPEGTMEGLHIQASAQDGSMITEFALPHTTEVIQLTLASGVNMEAKFLWHARGTPDGALVELPFTIPASATWQKIDLNVDAYPQWDRRADLIGFTFPKGADLLFGEMRFVQWNVLEKAMEIGRSFWTFDKLSAFSINFLWGPVITFNPVATVELFTTLPPRGRSGMWIFYIALALCAAGILGYQMWTEKKQVLFLPLFFLCFAALWIVFDIRMGLELLSYAKNDYDTYLSQPTGEKKFRAYLNFNDVMEQSLPFLIDQKEFAFLTTRATPVVAMVRYFTLPAVPTDPGEPREDLKTWLIFHRDDVTVGTDGRLMVAGVAWSKPGKIVKQFDETTFLFQTNE